MTNSVRGLTGNTTGGKLDPGLNSPICRPGDHMAAVYYQNVVSAPSLQPGVEVTYDLPLKPAFTNAVVIFDVVPFKPGNTKIAALEITRVRKMKFPGDTYHIFLTIKNVGVETIGFGCIAAAITA